MALGAELLLYQKAAECPGVSQLQAARVGSKVLVSSQSLASGLLPVPQGWVWLVCSSSCAGSELQLCSPLKHAPSSPGAASGKCCHAQEVLDVILWSQYRACIHVPGASCSQGAGGWRLSPSPQGCGAYCSHSPVPYHTGHENFSFVEHCNSTLFEAPEGEEKGTGDSRYLLGDQLPPLLPEFFIKAWPDAFLFVSSFLFNNVCFLIRFS